MTKHPKKQTGEKRGRKALFHKGRMVSFKTDRAKAEAINRAAQKRQIPASMWMREAAEEKMAREAAL